MKHILRKLFGVKFEVVHIPIEKFEKDKWYSVTYSMKRVDEDLIIDCVSIEQLKPSKENKTK